MHIHWVMTYHAPDNQSHYAMVQHSQRAGHNMSVGFGDLVTSLESICVTVIDWVDKRGASNAEVGDWVHGLCTNCHRYHPFFYKFLLFLLESGFDVRRSAGMMPVSSIISLACMMCVSLCFWCRRWCMKAKRAEDHPTVRCAQQCPCPGF